MRMAEMIWTASFKRCGGKLVTVEHAKSCSFPPGHMEQVLEKDSYLYRRSGGQLSLPISESWTGRAQQDESRCNHLTTYNGING